MSIGVDRADADVKLKTVYTCTEDSGADGDDGKATVHVVNADNTTTAIPRIKSSEHYRYLGVWISLTLDWTKHIAYIDGKIARYAGFLSNRCFTAAQCVLAMNRILTPRAAYGFTVAEIPEKKLKAWDKRVASTIHRKLHITTLRSANMLHASYEQGGVALLSLRHMYTAMRANTMYQTLNNADEQTKQAACTVWNHCCKQKVYGKLSGGASYTFEEHAKAREDEGAEQLRTYLTERTISSLPQKLREELIQMDVRVLFEQIPSQDDEGDNDGSNDDSDYSDSKKTHAYYSIASWNVVRSTES